MLPHPPPRPDGTRPQAPRRRGAGGRAGTRRRWGAGGQAPSAWGATPGATPVASLSGLTTPLVPGQAVALTADQYKELKAAADADARSRPLSDDDLDALLPGPADGYKVVPPPAAYVPIRTPARKLLATPTPLAGAPGYYMIPADDTSAAGADLPPSIEGLPDLKPDDVAHFAKLLATVDEATLTAEEAKERKIMALLLKVKNGAPPQRKSALRTLGDKARDFGAGPLFNAILPLLMSPTLEDTERHVLVKVVDRVLAKLDDLVRPYAHKILVVIEPLLIDEDYYARIEGREIIANLAKAAGLATMIAAMRPDVDAVDEYVRNTTARARSPSWPPPSASPPSSPSSKRCAGPKSRGKPGTRGSRWCSRPRF